MRRLIVLACCVTLTGGCQSSPRFSQHVELLNAEKRMIEDELYALQFDYEELVNETKELRRQNRLLQQRLGIPGTVEPTPMRPLREPRNGSGVPDLRPPTVDEGILTEPKVELPGEKPDGPSAAPASLPAPLPPPTSKLGKLDSDSHPEISPAASVTAWSQEPSDPRITQLYLDPLRTGGVDMDRQPGDDGLLVVIEPRNREDQFVPLAGPITVVLLDPALPGEDARVARWEIEAAAAQAMLQNSPTQRGIELRLPWPENPPIHNRGEVYVRYETLDGRKIEAHCEVNVALPGQVTQRWTPRPTSRLSPGRDQVPEERPVVAAGLESALPEWRPTR